MSYLLIETNEANPFRFSINAISLCLIFLTLLIPYILKKASFNSTKLYVPKAFNKEDFFSLIKLLITSFFSLLK